VIAPEDLTLLRLLAARGRFTGTEALAVARGECAGALQALGFTTREQPFHYSTAPARMGMPAVGIASFALLAIAAAIASRGWVAGAATFEIVGLVLLSLFVRWLSSSAVVLDRALDAEGVNLEATRGEEPRVWLVAHLDSKSQRFPLALRAAGASLTILAWACMPVLLALDGRLGAHYSLVVIVGGLGAALLGLASVGNESPGAVDNASGVVAVLAAARLLPRDAAVGVLITDAEEMGLAGAHAWARGRSAGTAINCDTVDDTGTLMMLTSGPRALSRTVSDAAMRGARTVGVNCRVRRPPRGVLTDGVALTRAGWSCATLGRATLGTLLRIHTRRDSVEHLEGAGIASAAALLAAMVQELC